MSVISICGEALKEVSRRYDGNRWCFRCCDPRAFEFVISAPVGPMSYYGPTFSVQCASCGLVDGDLFPGRSRSWDT